MTSKKKLEAETKTTRKQQYTRVAKKCIEARSAERCKNNSVTVFGLLYTLTHFSQRMRVIAVVCGCVCVCGRVFGLNCVTVLWLKKQ